MNFLVRNSRKIFTNFPETLRISSTNNMATNSCIFCDIISGTSPSKIIYQDSELIAFHDIKPVTKNHFLMVPKEHYENINVLNASHIPLVEKMVETAKKVLEDLGGDLNDVRFGFHCPPFNSIKHLHLHCLSPVSEMAFLHKMMFRPNTWWFSSADQSIENLKSKI